MYRSLLILSLAVSAPALAITPAPRAPGGAASQAGQPAAPQPRLDIENGVVDAVDVRAGTLKVNGRTLATRGLVVRDDRNRAEERLGLAALKPGMRITYRKADHSEAAPVVEAWIQFP
jgi:hypothetical protein